MNKIIKGRKYNTETAEEVASWHSRNLPDDLRYCTESLYRKKTGEFFLLGKGGAMSKYAETIGDNPWSGGERIIPLLDREAREWAENHVDGDTYENIFGECPE